MRVSSADPGASDMVARLVTVPRTCKAKTTIVPSLQLSCAQVQLLDETLLEPR
jgi:hypothetical protein